MWYGNTEANTATLSAAQQLMEQQRDFDFVDEQSLSSLMTIEKGSIKNLSGASYQAVIIPAVSIMPAAVYKKLQQFSSSGGKVIFLGKIPSLITDKNFLEASKAEIPGWAKQEPSGKITPEVLNSLAEPDVTIDKSCPSLKYIHRQFADGELYFFFNEGTEKQSFKITLSGKGKVQVWDALTGQISALQNISNGKDAITVPLDFESWETKFIIISK
jgi:hypothetical protein